MYLIGTFVTDAAPKDALGDLDFFRFPIIDPAVPLAEEAPTDGYFASAKTANPTGTKDLLGYLAGVEAQQAYVKASSGIVLPANPRPGADSPLVEKGKAMLNEAKEITQFFNRDSSDALQPTADTALTKFLDKPDQIDAILREWQAAPRRSSRADVTATISTTSVTPTRRRRRSARLSPLLVAFVLVPFAVESVWVFWPALKGFWFSLTRWDGMAPPQLRRYRQLRRAGRRRDLPGALVNTVIWLVLFGGLSVLGGFGMALVLQKERRCRRHLPGGAFTPVVFSLVVTALVWRVMYQPDGIADTLPRRSAWSS